MSITNTFFTCRFRPLTRNGSLKRRAGISLMESILSLTIFSGIAVSLTGVLQSTSRVLRQQELASTQNMSETTIEWIVDQIRSHDRCQVVSAVELRLTNTKVSPNIVTTLRWSGSQLLMIQGAATSVVCEPVVALSFNDPSGRGHAVGIQLSAGEVSSPQPLTTESRTVALDWIKQ